MITQHTTVFKLSVLLVTYNHEKYLRKALDCLFAQQYSEPIELVVADDSSSDSTMDIFKSYEKQESRFIFKYLDNSINLGITRNYQRAFAACSGEYIAVLEGDDYWISPFKLQRQVDFLDNHWESNLCSVNYLVYEENRAHFYPRTAIGQSHRLISARDLIADNLVGNFSTCMYRKSALDNLPVELFNIRSYDWIVNICVAQASMIGFLEEPMSVYRLHSKGVWSNTPHIKQLKLQLELIPAYNLLTNNIYKREFESQSNHLLHLISTANVANIAAVVINPTAGLITRLVDYLPPIVLGAIRIFTPPKLKRFIANRLRRGGA